MHTLSILAWVMSQVFIFILSIWFIVFGIRNWNEGRFFSVILFIFGFAGVLGVFKTVWDITVI